MTIDRDPNHLQPGVRVIMDHFFTAVRRRLGLILSCIETWRPGARQDDAYRMGLSEKRAGESHHNVELPDGTPASCAFHASIDPEGPLMIGFGDSLIHPPGCRTLPVDMGRHGVQQLGPEELLYCAVGLIGEEHGLTWGGRWNVAGKGPDWTHYQLAAPLSHILAAIREGRAVA